MMNIKILEVKPIGILKEEVLENDKDRISLLFWVSLLKDNKEKYLLFCINDYSFVDWPLNKLIINSNIKNGPNNIINQIAYRENIPHLNILYNLLYSNVEIYTQYSGCLYKKNEVLTKENVLTGDEEQYVKKVVCKYIHELDGKIKEYYKQQIEKLIAGNSEAKTTVPRITHFKIPKSEVIYLPNVPSTE